MTLYVNIFKYSERPNFEKLIWQNWLIESHKINQSSTILIKVNYHITHNIQNYIKKIKNFVIQTKSKKSIQNSEKYL